MITGVFASSSLPIPQNALTGQCFVFFGIVVHPFEPLARAAFFHYQYTRRRKKTQAHRREMAGCGLLSDSFCSTIKKNLRIFTQRRVPMAEKLKVNYSKTFLIGCGFFAAWWRGPFTTPMYPSSSAKS
jgi:hypothetical protein